jgi:hypothetical protein
MKRIMLAGILGGIALFLWEGLAHEVLPLGEAGVKAAPNETAFIAAVRDNFQESGFYFFPAPNRRPGRTAEQSKQDMDAFMQKWKTGPAGIMILQRNGSDLTSMRYFLAQCGFDIVAMLVAAFVLTRAPQLRGYLSRVTIVTLLAAFPILQGDLPYWNWYAFPDTYTMAQIVTRIVGFFIGGLIVAKFVKADLK